MEKFGRTVELDSRGWSIDQPSQYHFPLLERVFSHYSELPHDVSKYVLVCCQHLLEPQEKMFDKLIAFGFKPENIYLLGKAYSTNQGILSELQAKGVHAVQPAFSCTAFDVEHKRNCEALEKQIPNDAECVILDDGGQLIEVFLERQKKVVFAVEQTSSGFRKLENKNIPFPVINVARSQTKLVQESPFIAKNGYERILEYFNGNIPRPVLVVGLGPIGEALTSVLKDNGISVDGFDIRLGHTNLIKRIQEQKPAVIVGATGSNIVTKEDIEILGSETMFLISISSSDREFPVVEFRNSGSVHQNVKYKNLTFVNNGFPISFCGKRNEIDPAEIEKTISLLGGSVMHGIIRPISGEGLVDVPQELESLINQ